MGNNEASASESSSSDRSRQSLFRRDPFQALQQEFDNMVSRISKQWEGGGAGESDIRVPELDLIETPTDIQVTMDVPGVTADEVDLQVVGLRLHVRAEHVEKKQEQDEKRHRSERRKLSYSRAVQLPCAVREELAEANLQNGVLTIRLPKQEEEKSHKIDIQG